MTDSVIHPNLPSPIHRTNVRDRVEELPRGTGPLAGLLAMLMFLVTIEILRRTTGITSLIDALADAILYIMPMQGFSLALDIFGAQAKTMLLVGVLLALLLSGAWLGARHARQVERTPRAQWTLATSRGVALFGFSALFMLWFIGQRSPLPVASRTTVNIMGHLALASAVFTIVLGAAVMGFRALGADAPETKADPQRRRLATYGLAALGVLAGGSVLGRAVAKVANRPTVGLNDPGEISPPITSNEDFYLISKNFSDPSDDPGNDWTLTVDGLVNTELKLTPADLEAMAAPAFVSTLNCISNPVGGPLISTAQWRGARLADVLNRAGVGPGAADLVMTGIDDYTDSIPIAHALQPEPHLVWEMNGERLPQRHGVPLRLIVPGIYGMKNVKWLTKLTVVNNNYQGFWEQRGWTDDATVKTMSRFDVPGNRDVLNAGNVEIGGVAFAGDRGIAKVEVSTDGGSTWTEATIRDNPSPAGLSWVIWVLDWVAKPGTYKLAVRATDGQGTVQTDEHAPELPDGASGFHQISIGVS